MRVYFVPLVHSMSVSYLPVRHASLSLVFALSSQFSSTNPLSIHVYIHTSLYPATARLQAYCLLAIDYAQIHTGYEF